MSQCHIQNTTRKRIKCVIKLFLFLQWKIRAWRLSTAGSISQPDAVTIRASSRWYWGSRQGRLGYRRNPLEMRPSAHLCAVKRVHLLGIGRTAHGEAANGCSSCRSALRLLGYIWPLLPGFGRVFFYFIFCTIWLMSRLTFDTYQTWKPQNKSWILHGILYWNLFSSFHFALNIIWLRSNAADKWVLLVHLIPLPQRHR